MLWFKSKAKYIYKLDVSGMGCSKCELRVTKAIQENFNVKKVNADHSLGLVTIYSSDCLDIERLKNSIEKAGYQVTKIY